MVNGTADSVVVSSSHLNRTSSRTWSSWRIRKSSDRFKWDEPVSGSSKRNQWDEPVSGSSERNQWDGPVIGSSERNQWEVDSIKRVQDRKLQTHLESDFWQTFCNLLIKAFTSLAPINRLNSIGNSICPICSPFANRRILSGIETRFAQIRAIGERFHLERFIGKVINSKKSN